MDAAPAPSLYPLHRCKIVHLVRHAEGIHNIEGAVKDKTSPEFFDACLSPLGWEQAENLRKHVNACGLLKRIELVIVSPLLRTMQTATVAFGGDIQASSSSVTPLMVENVKGQHGAVSSLNCPPFIAHELCRERVGINTADKRRNISEYKNLFPAIDFSLVESDDDIMWTTDVRESDEELAARGLRFLKWLWTRKEKEIAIVTHSAFLLHTLQKFGGDCHPSVKSEMSKLRRRMNATTEGFCCTLGTVNFDLWYSSTKAWKGQIMLQQQTNLDKFHLGLTYQVIILLMKNKSTLMANCRMDRNTE